MFEFPVFNRFTLQPAQPFQSSFVRNRSALQVFSHRINQPHSWAVAESPAKPETVLSMPQANGLIGSLGKGEFRFRASPSLIRQIGCLQPDGIVEYERPLMIADRPIVRGNDVEAPIRCPHAIAEAERGRNRFELTIDG